MNICCQLSLWAHSITMTHISKSVAALTWGWAVFVVSRGILLPGPCPHSLPTMYIEDLDFSPKRSLHYIQVVPFAHHHSLLFAKPILTSAPKIYQDRLEWHLDYQLKIGTTWKRSGDFLTMRSLLTKDTAEKYKGCATTTTARVKVWYEKSWGIICVEADDEGHDEAVSLLSPMRF